MSTAADHTTLFRHGAKYTTVGVLGTCVKLGAIKALHDMSGLGWLIVTAIAVELSMLHNFAWHACWTWRDRPASRSARAVATRLLRFQCGNGAVALIVNLISMPALTAGAGFDYVSAALISSALGGMVNFALSDRWVFAYRDSSTFYSAL